MKKKTVSYMKIKVVWPLFSRYIRMRDCLQTTGSLEYGECFTCDFSGHISELQAGHFVPKHSGNYFSERGVHAQCQICNLFGRGKQAAGMPLEYRRHLVELYGEEVALELERENQPTKKFSISELEALADHYKKEIKILRGVE